METFVTKAVVHGLLEEQLDVVFDKFCADVIALGGTVSGGYATEDALEAQDQDSEEESDEKSSDDDEEEDLGWQDDDEEWLESLEEAEEDEEEDDLD